MRKSELKGLHDVSIGLQVTNDILIKHALEKLEEEGLSEEARRVNVKVLKTELELRKTLENNKNLYKERKASDRGYWCGVSGCMLGLAICKVYPVVIKHLKKN